SASSCQASISSSLRETAGPVLPMWLIFSCFSGFGPGPPPTFAFTVLNESPCSSYKPLAFPMCSLACCAACLSGPAPARAASAPLPCQLRSIRSCSFLIRPSTSRCFPASSLISLPSPNKPSGPCPALMVSAICCAFMLIRNPLQSSCPWPFPPRLQVLHTARHNRDSRRTESHLGCRCSHPAVRCSFRRRHGREHPSCHRRPRDSRC